MPDQKYQSIVIGSGPGGYVAALHLGHAGQKTALLESRTIGGTCLNRGCIPAKALLHSSQIVQHIRDGQKHGITVSDLAIDLAAMVKRKNAVVSRLDKGVETLCKHANVDVLLAAGSLLDKHTVQLAPADGDKQTLHADNIILATGSAPAVPSVFPADRTRVLTSDEALDLTTLPKSVLIVGGGYIGCEFATFFIELGVDVTLVEMLDRFLPMADADVSAAILKQLKKAGVTCHTATRVESLTTTDSGIHAKLSNGDNASELDADLALICTGRRPVTDTLNLDAAGVKLDDHGFIAIDDHCRTNVDNIYAIGDVTGKVQLAHVASRQAAVAANNILGHEDSEDYAVVPAAVYTHPETASVGLTEQQCKDQGLDYRTATFPMRASGMALAYDDYDGFVKLLAGDHDRILGAHLVCPDAFDVIQEIAVLMKSECTLLELADTIHPHPTFAEAIAECANKLLHRPSHG